MSRSGKSALFLSNWRQSAEKQTSCPVRAIPSRLTPTVSMPHSPFQNFQEASRAALVFLHQRLGFALWMVTRTEGDDWIVLHAEDYGYGVAVG